MSQTIAAIDLGSNSFHLLVVQDRGDEVLVVDKMRERVRLAAGLTKQNRLRASVRSAALDCLEVFGQRIADIPDEYVRVVGTNTLRKLGRGGGFLKRPKRPWDVESTSSPVSKKPDLFIWACPDFWPTLQRRDWW